MFNGVLLTVQPVTLPVAVAIFMLLVVAAAYTHRLPLPKCVTTKKINSTVPTLQIPPSLQANVPYVGHVLGFVRGGHGYFSSLCERTNLPIFTIRMAKVEACVIQTELSKALPKVRHLSLGPLVLQMFKRSLALGGASCSLLREDNEATLKFASDISRLFREEFIPNRKLRKYNEEIDGYIQRGVNVIEDNQTIYLENWIFKTLVSSLGRSLWGGDNGPFGDPQFVTHLRTFLMNIKKLNAPFDFMIDKKLLASRHFIRERLGKFSFEDFAEKCAERDTDTVEETFLGRLRELCLTQGAAVQGWTDYQLLLIAGLGPNVTAASTWMFHHLLADRCLLVRVCDELDELVKSSNGSIDVADMKETCPLLLATWYEVLRFHGNFSLGRYVHEDTPLASKYLLKKGSYALTPLRSHHYDQQVWGNAVDEFLPGRFLKEDGSLDEMQRRKLRVYGVFGTLCPGRYLAVNMAMALTIRVLLSFDMEPANGNYSLPHEGTDALAGLPTPAFDVGVRMRKRDDIRQGVKIHFKDGTQTL